MNLVGHDFTNFAKVAAFEQLESACNQYNADVFGISKTYLQQMPEKKRLESTLETSGGRSGKLILQIFQKIEVNQVPSFDESIFLLTCLKYTFKNLNVEQRPTTPISAFVRAVSFKNFSS